LAPYCPNKNSHPYYGFGDDLMEEDLVGLHHFNYKLTQREPKPSFEEASENHNFVLLGGTDIIVFASPHNRHVPKVSSSHIFKMTLFDG
jgi:hypothetical protein